MSLEGFNPNMHKVVLDLADDVPSLVRSAEGVISLVTGGSGDPGIQIGLGFTSVTNLATSSLAIYSSSEAAVRANEIGDVEGQGLAHIGQAKGALSLTNGMVQGSLRGLSLAALYTAAEAIVAAGRVLGQIGSSVCGALYSLVMIPPAILATKQIGFRQEFNAHNDLEFGKWFLLKQLQDIPEDERLAKEASLARVTGPETLRLVKEELDQPGSVSEELLVKTALDENQAKIVLNILVVTTCCIGLIGVILASVFTAGIPLYVALGVAILADVIMFGLDLTAFIQEVKDMQSAPKDRIFMLTLAAISILCISLGAFLATGPLATLIVILVGLVFAGLQLGVLGWSWYNYESSRVNEEV